ncbi:DUF3253 domain-containing protein [Shimia ponticola]|uniref:DUF3253 domain-containing protein n=1 Tax=Shimia ponticola TaxID=2582893 RepID=UPI0011BD58DA|nr:DUF3253 domain-containing protein [Shimia ponticola]
MSFDQKTKDELRMALLTLANERAPDKTFCPSEAARRVAENWRPLMPEVRRIAVELGLAATQKGVIVDPDKARGPIRLRQRP